tara:strand:- start:935 stop:1333 length:399 start_codon:yes stop_codon:yes gene_type:complete
MNDANKANFDEIDGHIKIIKAKLAKREDNQASLAEDIEDLYERKLQLRVMRNNDLTSELEQAHRVAHQLRSRMWTLGGVGATLFLLAAMTALYVLCPEFVARMVQSDTVHKLSITGISALAGSGITWYAMRR